MLTDKQIEDLAALTPQATKQQLAAAVAALAQEVKHARAGVEEGHRRMASLALQLSARGQWTPFREHRIRKALARPLRAD